MSRARPVVRATYPQPSAQIHDAGGGKMEAVIFVGIQGSGKTSFYLERFSGTHVRISLDLLRTRHREHVLFMACLQSKQSFVIDNTNPLPADRSRYIEPARAVGFRVLGYFFDTSLEAAIRRNNQRAGTQKIPVAAVAGTFRRLQPPTLAEGFDTLYLVRITAEGKFVVTVSLGPTSGD